MEREVDAKTRDISRRYDIPISEVMGSLAAGASLVGDSLASVDILGIKYISIKRRNLRKQNKEVMLRQKSFTKTK